MGDGGRVVALDKQRAIRQQDVQVILLADPKSPVSFLDYSPAFELQLNEKLWVYDAEGKLHAARLDFTTFASKYRSSQGPTEIHAVLVTPMAAAGASGSPVIQHSTGRVVGVLLGADDPVEATRLSFETLCLPDQTPKAPPPAAPLYADPRQRAAYQDLVAFSKDVPEAHWRASERFFNVWKVKNPDTLEDVLRDCSVTVLEVKPSADATWEGAVRLVDQSVPGLEWAYTLRGKKAIWSLTGLLKIQDGKTTDVFDDDALMKRLWITAIDEVAQKKGRAGVSKKGADQ